ncbi:MAG: thioredoxin peroxidase [Peptococcaceae bacterium BICA1-8]|nr:MAG: thioredoxin peroxidase [Peptococcaceae bacterium BICA1-8]
MENKNLISVGDNAPDFNLKDNRGEVVKLSDYLGKKILLSWHPLAWTNICAKQMKSLEDNLSEFTKLNTIPLGLSVDAYPSKNAWAKHLEIANVKLPADFWPHGGVAKEYGLFREEEGFSERANIIINEQGKVAWVQVYQISELPDINQVLEAIGNL